MTPRRRMLTTLAALALVAVAALALHATRKRTITPVRISTGTRGGTFLPLGRELAETFSREIRHVRAQALESPGSEASLQRLARREVEMALVSNNARGVDSVRLIAPLYEETLQVVVRAESGITDPHQLRARRVSVGPAGSGTEVIAWQVMNHFDVTREQVRWQNLPPLDAAAMMERNELDAVFIVAGMRTPVVERLLRRGDMRLLSLGDPSRNGSALEGLRIDAPYLLLSVIPEHTYGDHPATPVGTISVRALLVTRADVSDELVHEFTRVLFANKVRLAERERLLARLTERFDATDSPYPLHPGADRYLRRDDPTFLSRHADEMSITITFGALLWSAASAVNAWRRQRRRGRVEVYFEALAALAHRRRTARTQEERLAIVEEIESLRIRALAELADERLEPNESFRVLQELLRTEREALERAIVTRPEGSERPAA